MSRNNFVGAGLALPDIVRRARQAAPLRKIGPFLLIGLQALAVLAAGWLVIVTIFSLGIICGGR